MPRRDDDELDDDRPRRGPRDDDGLARPRRSRDDDDYDSGPPKKKSNLALILIVVFGILFVVCGGAIGIGCVLVKRGVNKIQNTVENAADRMNSNNNLKEIGIGVIGYTDKYDDYPSNSYTADGKPLLSWRVHILPFIGEQALYNQFKLDEPWDSANNKRLLSQMPRVYATPAEQMGRVPKGTTTYYRGFSNQGTMFAQRGIGPQPKGKGGGNRLRMNNITDGLSNTILLVEAGDAVEWTKPDDLDASPNKPFPKLGGVRPTEDHVLALFVDGSVRALKKSNLETNWRAASTYAGGEVVFLDE